MPHWTPRVIALVIVAFWALMNGLLVRRELEYRNLDLYRRGIVQFLGNNTERSRWMGIYRNSRKIGYTGFTLTKSFADTGIEHIIDLESLIAFDLFGKGHLLRLEGEVIADHLMVPVSLEMTITIGSGGIALTGERRDGKLHLSGKAGDLRIFEQELELTEIFLGDGPFPILPIAGLAPGQTYEVPVWDPISQQAAEATVRVIEKTVRNAGGVKVDCFILETRFLGLTYTSWVTPDGDTLRLEVPPPYDIILRQETREDAPKGVIRARSAPRPELQPEAPQEER